MQTIETVESTDYLSNNKVIETIDALNSVGEYKLIQSVRSFGDDGGIPLTIVNPYQRPNDPLKSFEEGFNVRVYGAANGHRIIGQAMLSSLVAGISEKPVVNVPFPNRDWSGDRYIDKSRGWNLMNEEQRNITSISQFDAYADYVLKKIERSIDGKGVLSIGVSGESMGSAVALSILNKSKNFDKNAVSVAALPNLEYRSLYNQLFLKDFSSAGDGIIEQITASSDGLLYEPYVRAQLNQTERMTKIIRYAEDLNYLLRDILGTFPPLSDTYKNNRALVRSLTTYSGILQMYRILNIEGSNRYLHVGMFENDKVAKPSKLADAISLLPNDNGNFYIFENVGHSACQNPYIIGFMATKLLPE